MNHQGHTITLDNHRPPLSITDHQASGVLALQWQDGSESRLPHWLLRSLCRCAACEQQWRRTACRPQASFAIRLEDIKPIGDKGLNLEFSDGHGRGIYPWAYLHEIDREHSGSREAPVPAAIAGMAPAALP